VRHQFAYVLMALAMVGVVLATIGLLALVLIHR
jgi:hypothetical protein